MKKGFTIAELAMTIGVLGLLSLLLLPILKKANLGAEEVIFKKAFNTSGQITDKLANGEEFYDSDLGFSDTRKVKYGNDLYATGNSKFCKLFASKLSINGNIACSQKKSLDNGGNFTTIDGITWSLPITAFDKGKEKIEVDVNGADGHNCFAYETGCNEKHGRTPDRFFFYVDKFGKITLSDDDGKVITGDDDDDDCTSTSPVSEKCPCKDDDKREACQAGDDEPCDPLTDVTCPCPADSTPEECPCKDGDEREACQAGDDDDDGCTPTSPVSEKCPCVDGDEREACQKEPEIECSILSPVSEQCPCKDDDKREACQAGDDDDDDPIIPPGDDDDDTPVGNGGGGDGAFNDLSLLEVRCKNGDMKACWELEREDNSHVNQTKKDDYIFDEQTEAQRDSIHNNW